MKTRIRKLVVCGAMLATATLVQAQFNYTDNRDGTCTITKYTGLGGAVTIPDTINLLAVVSIGDAAFTPPPGALGVTSVTIPDGLTDIGNYAFGNCYNLSSVTIGNGVTFIGDGAFSLCTRLTNVAIGAGVTSIGFQAFYYCTSLTNVAIPASVTSIGLEAFYYCTKLTAITVDAANWLYSSANGVLFDKNQTTLIAFPTGRGGIYTIPARVTNIGNHAFAICNNLTSVTIPSSVTSMGYSAFEGCGSLTAAYFLGNAPYNGGSVFGVDPVIVYYLPGATGWGPFFSGVPTELWNPQASALGVTGGHFGFNIAGPSNTVIVVEACTNLAHPVWLPVSTNALNGGGASSFSDPQSADYPARFYRFRSP